MRGSRRAIVRAGVMIVVAALVPARAGQAAGDPHLGPEHLLLLVNLNSPVSVSVANLYREYHPQIQDEQVLYLSGLPDCASASAGPANEIITRTQFETYIAQPLREYLVARNLADRIRCFVTTAGLPYRIADSDPTLAGVVTPGASDATLTVTNRYRVDAACVESELAVLFQIDPSLAPTSRASPQNRLVNPYQAYRSGICSWEAERDVLGRRGQLRWAYIWRVSKSPRIEGLSDSSGYSAKSRVMSPADIYLVARLDGPRRRGQLPIFSVNEMLRRAAAVSNPASPSFLGYNRRMAAVVLDGAPGAADRYSYSQVFNCPPSVSHLTYYWHKVPPGAEAFSGQFNESDHYVQCFTWLTGSIPVVGTRVWQPIDVALRGSVLWAHTDEVMSQSYLRSGMGLFALLTYGCNSNDGRRADYLLAAGPGGGRLFKCVPGAVFSSLESFNAVTMFTDTYTGQAKIAQFIEMGGTAAVGHVFEPERGATFQGDFLLSNLLRDDDGDGVGDLTWVESAFTAMPYLSWAELVIGDPLMQLHSGPGGLVRMEERPGDANGDGRVAYEDLSFVLQRNPSTVGSASYHPDADVTRDGQVNWDDVYFVINRYGTVYP